MIKARWAIFGTLLLALSVSPTAMRAMPRTLSLFTPPTAKSQTHTNRVSHRHSEARKVVSSQPGHRPATRLHKIRGKKLSVDRDVLNAQASSAPSQYVFSIARVRQQDTGGPNPSRGPPAQSL